MSDRTPDQLARECRFAMGYGDEDEPLSVAGRAALDALAELQAQAEAGQTLESAVLSLADQYDEILSLVPVARELRKFVAAASPSPADTREET